MPFDPSIPYNDLPDLPPPIEIETRAVLKACIDVRTSLAELNAIAMRLPNPSILISALMLFEAKSSSEIENIVTTDDKLFQHSQLEESTNDAPTKEALRYRDALFMGYQRLADLPISSRLTLETCSILKGHRVDIRRIPGTTLRSLPDGNIIYTPPVGEELIRAKLHNWERFIHNHSEFDPLVQLAIQHYQFEAIHPFLDGNGRTGRIINVLFLIEKKLLDLPILYMSREILQFRSDYYDKLGRVTRDHDWISWILYMLNILGAASARTRVKVSQISVLMIHTELYLASTGEHKLASREILDILFTQPYCRISDIVTKGIAKRQTAASYLRELVQLGVLQEVKVGREKLFLHKKFHELLSTDGSSITEYQTNALARGRLLFPPTAQTA